MLFEKAIFHLIHIICSTSQHYSKSQVKQYLNSKLNLLSNQSLQNQSSSLNIYVDRNMSNTIHLTTQIEQGTAFVFLLNILAQFGFMCVHPWVLVPGFSHYMPGCVTGYLFPATGRSSPLLLGV